MENLHLVSVVIPCYKQAHFLDEAIKSVLAQSYPNLEIIVVDDGSPDNTEEVVASYPHVHYLRQKNQGRSIARNVGAQRSNGSYLVFLDADDRLLPHALEVGINCLSAHPERAYSAGHYVNIAEDGLLLPTATQPVVQGDHYLSLLRGGECVWLPAAVMFRRDAFKYVGGFNSRLEAAEDLDIYLRISREFPVYCHGEVIAEYRQHLTNTTHQSGLMLQSAIKVLHSQRSYVRGKPIYEEAYIAGVHLFQNYYGGSLIQSLAFHLREKKYVQWRQVLRDLRILLQYHPQGVFKLLGCVVSPNSILHTIFLMLVVLSW